MLIWGLRDEVPAWACGPPQGPEQQRAPGAVSQAVGWHQADFWETSPDARRVIEKQNEDVNVAPKTQPAKPGDFSRGCLRGSVSSGAGGGPFMGLELLSQRTHAQVPPQITATQTQHVMEMCMGPVLPPGPP